MALYIIGDIQGCYDQLQRLLQRVDYDAKHDELWFVGDLVNRGPKSLETLRFIKSLQNCVCVLGNHDLHLLAVAYGGAKCASGDTLEEILTAPDRDELLQWLRFRPVLHLDEQRNLCMVHAGLAPQWTMKVAKSCAQELQEVLRSDRLLDFFSHMYGDKPRRWKPGLEAWDRIRFITNCLTRLRFINSDGGLALKLKGPVDKKPDNYQAWFAVEHQRGNKTKIIFGHWSALGLHESDNILAIDSGCVWGGALTAAKFNELGLFEGVSQVQCDIVSKLAK